MYASIRLYVLNEIMPALDYISWSKVCQRNSLTRQGIFGVINTDLKSESICCCLPSPSLLFLNHSLPFYNIPFIIPLPSLSLYPTLPSSYILFSLSPFFLPFPPLTCIHCRCVFFRGRCECALWSYPRPLRVPFTWGHFVTHTRSVVITLKSVTDKTENASQEGER